MEEPKGKNFVTVLFAITACGLLIFTVLWGSFKGEWDALSRSGFMIGLVFGHLLEHYYGS